jgi:antibiotic biosynthesis monooxygenase (ABM) superfamily enzyme
MIARHWRGWTTPNNGDSYENLLKEKILPMLKDIPGYKGGYVLRRNVAGEVEFVVINLFDSIEAVQAFAGPDYTVAKFEPEARQLLAKVEPFAHHYEICASTV